MKKNKTKILIFKSLFFSTSISLPLMAVSCSNPVNSDISYTISQNFFNEYDNNQLAELVKFAKIFLVKKNNQNINYFNAKISENKITFNALENTYVSNYEPKPIQENPQSFLADNLFIQYSAQQDKNSIFYLNEEFEKRYQNKLFVPDLQMTIFKILLNKQNFNSAIPNWIDINSIRSKSWIKNEEQKSYLENLLSIHLKHFDIKSKDNRKFEKVKFTNLKNGDFDVSFNIDLLDDKNTTILENPNQTEFFINRFLNYQEATPQRLNFQNNSDEILFNEYLNFPDLKFKLNPLSFTNYDNFVDGTFNLNSIYTAKSFTSFLKRFPNLIDLQVPFEKRLEDAKYEITDKVEYADFPQNTFVILKLEVKVTKKDGSVVFYPWYSIDFNRHYHLFKGYVPTLNLNYRQSDLWSFLNLRGVSNANFEVPSGIDANTFFENAIINISSYSFWKHRNNLNIWSNKTLNENEAFTVFTNKTPSIKYIENEIANLVLSYLISNKKNDFLSGIKDVKLEYVGYKNPGSLLIKINFLDNSGNSLLSSENQNKIISIDYFKGANTKDVLEWLKNNTDDTNLSLTNFPPIAKFVA